MAVCEQGKLQLYLTAHSSLWDQLGSLWIHPADFEVLLVKAWELSKEENSEAVPLCI